jgi:hypothetical protein
MGWFNKKDKGDKKDKLPPTGVPELPKLPELPELPELSKTPRSKEPIHQLPSFPNNSLGQKFSQNTIKQAVTRAPKEPYDHYPEEKRGERVFEANDFAPPKKGKQMMPKPLPKKEFSFPHTKEISEEEPEFDIEDFKTEPNFEEEPEMESPSQAPLRREPVFIRIDRFEKSLRIFEKVKRELSEIERVLNDIEKVKEDEQSELESWKTNVLQIKEQIEKVDRDVFSKLE